MSVLAFGSTIESRVRQLFDIDRFGATPNSFRQLLESAGLKVNEEKFQLTVPNRNSVGTLSSGSVEKTVYPLWPNGVQTSACDLKGSLLFAGKGRISDFRGRVVAEKIVVLDFESGSNWRNAATLGARAVIYIGNPNISRFESEQKWSAVSLDFPRFYCKDLSGLNEGQIVSLKCDQKWVDVEASNFWITVPGIDNHNSKDWILLAAYYDTVSVVPFLPHGAEQSCGAGFLIEMANYFRERPPKRNLLILFTAGHFSAMQGIREFVASRMSDGWRLTGGNQPRIAVQFDISSRSRSVSILGSGWWLDCRQETYSDTFSAARSVSDLMPKVNYWDGVTNPDGRNFKNNVPGRFASEAELLNLAGQPAFTFFTSNDIRPFADSPADTLENLNWENLEYQFKTALQFCQILLNSPEDRSGQARASIRLPEPKGLSGLSLSGGFATVGGKVLTFDARKSFRPNVPVPGALVVLKSAYHTYLGVRGTYLMRTDSDGNYKLKGLPVITAFPEDRRGPTILEAFSFDNQQKVVQAIDFGQQTSDDYASLFWLKTAYRASPLVLFDAKPICFFSAANALSYASLNVVNVFDSVGDNYTKHMSVEATFASLRFQSYRDTGIVVYVPKSGKFKFQISELFGPLGMVLLNSNDHAPGGAGFDVQESNLAGRVAQLQSARDLDYLNSYRSAALAKRGIVNSGIDDVLRSAKTKLQEADNAIKKMDYPVAIESSREALALGMQAYPILKSTARDMVFGLGFYLALLIPFSIFMERLLFQSNSVGRHSVFAALIFSIVFVTFRLIHPAFDFAENTLILYIAFIMGALSVMVITFLIGKFESTIQAMTNQKERSGGAVTTSGIAIGLSLTSMKRRKLRSITTTASIAIATFCVICFTSVSPTLRFNEIPVKGAPPYPGILLRNLDFAPLEGSTADELALAFPGTSISPRIWYYGAEFATTSMIPLRVGEAQTNVTALLGISMEEDKLTKVSKTLTSGRYFTSDDALEFILPASVAKRLNISDHNLGEKLEFAGLTFRVVGIADDVRLKSILDLDSESIMPADFSSSRRLQNLGAAGSYAFRTYVRCEPSVVAIIPTQVALQIGGDLRCVAVGFPDFADSGAALRDWMPKTGLNVYGGVNGSAGPEICRFSTVASSKTTGLEFVLIPLLIAGLIVFNTMLTTVLERKNEIGIFGAIGLNPKQIGSLFFCESIIYVVLGSIFGYLLAQGFGYVNREYEIFQFIQLNFSSASGVLATLLMSAVVLSSSIYPAKLSGKLANAGHSDNWALQEPVNDEWDFNLPFTVSTSQSESLLSHYQDWLLSHQQFMVGSFVSADSQVSGNVVKATVWLAPFDLGVQQIIELALTETELPEVFSVSLKIVRQAGDPEHWKRLNGRFLQEVRRAFLSWRTKVGSP